MAGGYDVSVKLNLVDNASKKLKSIEQNIDRVVKSAQAYNTVIEKLTRSFNALNKSLNTTSATLNSVNNAMNKLGSNNTSSSIKGLGTAQQTYNNHVKTGTANQKAFNREGSKIKNTTANVNALSDAQGKLNYKIGQGANMMTSLKGSLGSIAGAYLGIETVKTALDWSDTLTLTEGKLAQLTDDVEGFMNKAYQMSQDTRTSYMDNASQMAKMWQLTGGAEGIFETEDKLIEFNELLNKGFILGGSGVREINASLYQLTQALSSGRLQGDELRSLAENAPYLINTIVDSVEEMYNAGKDQSEWIDLTYNDFKKLGAEGVLTSELITNAVLNSADEIRDAYKNVKPTWEQTFTSLKNQVQKVSQPILRTINDLINSEAFEKTVQALVKIFAVVMAFLNPILQGIMAIGEVISDNWAIVEPIIWGIVGALAAYLSYLALAKVYTFALGIVQGFQLIMSKGVGLSLVQNTKALAIYNGYTKIATVWSNMLGAAKMFLAGATWSAVVAEYGLIAPLLLIIAVIGAVIGAVYLIVYAYNKWTDSTISATGIIVGAFYWMYAYVYNVIARIWNELVEFAEFIANLFNDPVYTIKKAFGDLAISVINIWMGINDAIINIVNSIKDTINGFLGTINDMINAVVDVYNNTLGNHFGKWGKVNLELTTDSWEESNKMLEGWKTSITNWVGEPNKTPISYDDMKMEYKDLGEYWDKGYAKGEKWENDIAGMFNTDKLLEGLDTNYTSDIPGIDEYLNSIPDYDTPNVGGSTDLPDDLKNAIDDIKGNTDDLANMGEEDLKYLKDIAEQKVINRFTTAEIKVTNNMSNNISSNMDIDGMADYFAEVIEKACVTTAERVNTTG